MARKSVGPWFWTEKNGWFVHHEGRRHNLRVKGEENEAKPVKAWYRLMAAEEPSEQPKEILKATPEPTNDPTVKAVVDAFLAAKRPTVKAYSLAVYRGLLKRVTNTFGDRVAVSLKPSDFLQWVYSLSVSPSTRADITRVLLTAFRWAEGETFLPFNPLKNMKRPTGESRGAKAVVSEATHNKLMEVANPALRKLLTLLHETGARPSELSRLTAQDVDFQNSVAVLHQHKTDMTGKPRIIVITPKAKGVLMEQAKLFPSGSLLKNSKGKPWTKDSVGRAMLLASKRAGVKAIDYGYRHGFATDALANGVPDATVAALLGHSDTSMLHRHYGHLTSRTQALKDALAKVR